MLAPDTRSDLTVFAAASTSDVMKAIASAYEKHYNEQVRFNFASSGALAMQIDAGAPADLYISANVKWMDWLESKRHIEHTSRFDLAANQLVLIVSNQYDESRTRNKEPQNHEGRETLLHSTFLDRSSAVPAGRIAAGDFRSVPAGMYAEESLRALGWLEPLRPNLVMTSNVRTALLYVERGEVTAGIVYATDALASDKVKIIGTFPDKSHSPIVYPVASCSQKNTAETFLMFLKTDTAKQILKRHGFK